MSAILRSWHVMKECMSTSPVYFLSPINLWKTTSTKNACEGNNFPSFITYETRRQGKRLNFKVTFSSPSRFFDRPPPLCVSASWTSFWQSWHWWCCCWNRRRLSNQHDMMSLSTHLVKKEAWSLMKRFFRILQDWLAKSTKRDDDHRLSEGCVHSFKVDRFVKVGYWKGLRAKE